MDDITEKLVIEITNKKDIKIIHTSITDGIPVVSKKEVLPNALLELLSCSRENRQYLRLGNMPNNFYDGCIGENNSFKAVLFLQGGPQYSYYYGTSYLLPYPNMIFFIESTTKITQCKVFCTIESCLQLSNKSKLYQYPFSNVYKNGDICWGDISLPNIGKIKDFQIIPQLFINAEMNEHLYIKGECNKTDLPLRELLMTLEHKESFPEEFLNETSFSYGEFADNFLK